MAYDSIKANKLRAFLTMLGIIIGIGSVIAIVSLGQGGQQAITGEFEKLGSTTINISVNSAKALKGDYINQEDIKQIKEKIPSVRYATPMVQKRGRVRSDNKSRTAVITGGDTDLAYVENSEIIHGRYFNERELNEGRAVAVIYEATANSLFGHSDAVGESIKLGTKTTMKSVIVVGVAKGFSNTFGVEESNIPSFVSIPITFMRNLFSEDFVIDTIGIMASGQKELEAAGNSARSILESRHGNRGKDIYRPESSLKQLEQINKVIAIFTGFISSVAGISLIVGGIGVMNIMLVSVTERTREIGVRKALGATTGIILLQFLTESVIISLIGGLLGMLLGIFGAELIGKLAGISPTLSIRVIIGTIAFSSAVGIFFGIYPAQKAARLNPIDALRYE